MSDMTPCLNDLSYIPPNNEQNKPTQGDIGKTSNEPTQAIRNEFEELYVSANEELYPGHGENVESHPYNEELWNKVEVLEKSLKDLEQAREKDKELSEETIEQERKLKKKILRHF
ncbi:hypothetical protein Tco_0385148 [Tanacetum coccineum]